MKDNLRSAISEYIGQSYNLEGVVFTVIDVGDDFYSVKRQSDGQVFTIPFSAVNYLSAYDKKLEIIDHNSRDLWGKDIEVVIPCKFIEHAKVITDSNSGTLGRLYNIPLLGVYEQKDQWLRVIVRHDSSKETKYLDTFTQRYEYALGALQADDRKEIEGLVEVGRWFTYYQGGHPRYLDSSSFEDAVRWDIHRIMPSGCFLLALFWGEDENEWAHRCFILHKGFLGLAQHIQHEEMSEFEVYQLTWENAYKSKFGNPIFPFGKNRLPSDW